jgi:acylphosphatase
VRAAVNLRRDITFRGCVQGVYFRATTRELARNIAVTGWVRNEADGSVRCVVEGEGDEVQQFIEAICDAKRANIESVEVNDSLATGEFRGFVIR